jgi:hypothetical protein
MAERTYTAEEQAEISRRYPSIEWINGKPYTRRTAKSADVASTSPEGAPLDYLGNPVVDTGTELVEAGPKERFPWEFLALMAAAPALVSGGSALAGAGGGGAGGGAGAASASFGGLPVGTLASAPTAGMVTGLSAPGAIGAGAGAGAGIGGGMAGGGSAAGSGGAAGGGSSMLNSLGGWQGIASSAGRMFGSAAEASANTQAERAQLEQQRNSLLGSLYNTQQNAQMSQGQLDLQRKGFDESSEGSRLRRALIGQLLGNAQALDIDIPGIPKAKITGGLSVNSLGQGGRDIGAEMTARALEKLRAGNTYQGGNLVAPPDIAPVGQLGGNRFLNILGSAGSLLGGVAANGQRYPGTTP